MSDCQNCQVIRSNTKLYIILALEPPSIAQVTHSYSRRLPALGHKLRY